MTAAKAITLVVSLWPAQRRTHTETRTRTPLWVGMLISWNFKNGRIAYHYQLSRGKTLNTLFTPSHLHTLIGFSGSRGSLFAFCTTSHALYLLFYCATTPLAHTHAHSRPNFSLGG